MKQEKWRICFLIIKKSAIQSIVVTKDREFKHRSITFLNNIAFNAEKIAVDNVAEALAHIEQNPKMLNLVIDGTEFYSLVDTYAEDLKKLCEKPDLIALMFVDKPVPEETVSNLALSNLYIKRLPFEKGHFNEAFHNRGGKGTSAGIFPGMQDSAKQGAGQSGSGAAAKTPTQKKNITAFEATAHVRDTIAMLTIVDKNRGTLDQVIKIGQIFNGLVGAFAYFAKDGYQDLKNLAIIVDEISRYYDKSDLDKISDKHYELLYNSVKTSFLILQALRDNQTPKAELLEKSKELNEIYLKTDELEKRSMVDQGEIDKLLEGND